MVVVINAVQCPEGREPEAKEYILRRIEEATKANPNTKYYLLQPISGDMRELALMSMHPSLEAFADWHKRRRTIPELQALSKEAREAGLFLKRHARHFEVVEKLG